jgi:hypothetical protein
MGGYRGTDTVPYGSLWQFTAAVASPEFEDADHPQLVDFPLPWKCINICTCLYIYIIYISYIYVIYLWKTGKFSGKALTSGRGKSSSCSTLWMPLG